MRRTPEVPSTGAIPSTFRALLSGRPPDPGDAGWAVSGDDWLGALPRLQRDLLEQWHLTPDGAPRHGQCALALPVVGPEGPAVLKLTWPHVEAVTEHLALRHWDGRGAVRLLRADPRRFALLLERLDGSTDLGEVWVDEACETIGELLWELRSPAIARTPTLSAYAARQADAASPAGLPPRFADQARHLAADLAAQPGLDTHLLHTDLHFANVLAGQRQPWLAIDPKPMAGDPAFEVAPVLWNRVDELGTGSSIRWGLRRRLEIVCESAELDEDRARAWAIVRVVDWARDADAEQASIAVAILKAMND